MIDDENLRKGEQNYHDKVFEHEIDDLINVTTKRKQRSFPFSPLRQPFC
jgi:hypothetical protein